jgi:hypothetical protein
VRRVPQLDKTGCGVACVASVAGVSYAKARRLMFGSSPGSYTDTGDLRSALRKHGVKVGPRLIPLRTRSYFDLAHHAILKVNVKRSSGYWHWVVWDAVRRRLIDPRQPPYKRLRAVSFLKIEFSRSN